MEARRNTRKIAVQAVFQFFFSKEDVNKILEEFCNYRIKEFKNCISTAPRSRFGKSKKKI